MTGRGGALSRALARLAERRVSVRAGDAAETAAPAAPAANANGRAAAREEVGVESFLPGGVLINAFGKFYLHERLRSEIEKPKRAWGRFPVTTSKRAFLHRDLEPFAAHGFADAIFLDLETCGLSNAPVFLAGTMHWNGSDYVVRQYFARDYAEEAALIDALVRLLADFTTVVTYNGKSFDLPFLADRASLHKVPFTPPRAHVDLLHHARRRWMGILPNCRLVTLELEVCGRRRVGDVPSGEVPGLYHDFVKHGAAHRLIPVFHHNLLDVITMDEILRALVKDPARGTMVEDALPPREDWDRMSEDEQRVAREMEEVPPGADRKETVEP
jgi:uncharacterized protein YprB with RNaseH-like and TPR domain